MPLRRYLALFFALLAPCLVRLAASEGDLPAQFELPAMKTSVYVGSVTLITGSFNLAEDAYVATYEAKVWPWSFLNEAGRITLKIDPGDYARLVDGEAVDLSGEAKSGKGKTRAIKARAQPADATSGRIKVRVTARGTKLIFNGTYRVVDAAPTTATADRTEIMTAN